VRGRWATSVPYFTRLLPVGLMFRDWGTATRRGMHAVVCIPRWRGAVSSTLPLHDGMPEPKASGAAFCSMRTNFYARK